MIYCEYCNSRISEEAKDTCPNCGAPIPVSAAPEMEPTVNTAETVETAETSTTTRTAGRTAGSLIGATLLGSLLRPRKHYPTVRPPHPPAGGSMGGGKPMSGHWGGTAGGPGSMGGRRGGPMGGPGPRGGGRGPGGPGGRR